MQYLAKNPAKGEAIVQERLGYDDAYMKEIWPEHQFSLSPVRYVQTDNGLEFQKHFHAKCEEVKLEHFYIHKSSPNDNAVIERSFRTHRPVR